MSKTRRTYSDEFKREAVQLLETIKSARQLERELGIGFSCLARWKRELAAQWMYGSPRIYPCPTAPGRGLP